MTAAADPMVFHPDGCDFALGFPAAPTLSQIRTPTSRGDAVVTDKASLTLNVDGKTNYKTNYLRAECTHIQHKL